MENLINAPLFVQLTYFFLFLSTILLWLPKLKKVSLWCISIVLAIIFGLIGGTITFIALLQITILAASLYLLQNNSIFTILWFFAALVIFVLGVGFMAHLAPGFSNLLLLHHQKITLDAIPFTLYLNFDKVILGILILGFLHQRIQSYQELSNAIKLTYKPALIFIGIILVSCYAVHYVRFEPKLSEYLPLFIINNLFFVCLSEEAFFRGFIQKYLFLTLKNFKYATPLSILLAALLFGAQHYTGGPLYILLATIAGLGYGWIYFRTQRIEASILTHFFLNLIHFIFFTYPAIDKSFMAML